MRSALETARLMAEAAVRTNLETPEEFLERVDLDRSEVLGMTMSAYEGEPNAELLASALLTGMCQGFSLAAVLELDKRHVLDDEDYSA